jgi:hypothetical protein
VHLYYIVVERFPGVWGRDWSGDDLVEADRRVEVLVAALGSDRVILRRFVRREGDRAIVAPMP